MSGLSSGEMRFVEDIPFRELDGLLARFYLGLRRRDGGQYEPDTSTGVQNSMDRHLKDLNINVDIKRHEAFTHSRRVLEAKRKELVCVAANPTSLLNTVWLNNGIDYGFRGRQEHASLLLGDLRLNKDSSGTEYVEFLGSSQSSIYKFCQEKNIHKYDYGRLSQSEIQNIVSSSVQATGPTYGRKLVTGFLRSKGYKLGERIVRSSLLDISPFYVAQRRAGVERNTNPAAYYAEYAGRKLHMDQNEKLTEFGVTEVLASDGFSGKITAFSLMPIKNNLLIYDNVYRSTCLKYGLFDQIRVDFGKEFYLCLYHQENIKQYRTNTRRPEYVKTMYRQNHAAERKWVEVNSRINYPLIPSWNAHSIPGKGIPDRLFAANLQTQRLASSYFPPSEVVASQYIQDGGMLTMPCAYGFDPLEHNQILAERRDMFFSQVFPHISHIMFCLVNGNPQYFKDALFTLINITSALSR